MMTYVIHNVRAKLFMLPSNFDGKLKAYIARKRKLSDLGDEKDTSHSRVVNGEVVGRDKLLKPTELRQLEHGKSSVPENVLNVSYIQPNEYKHSASYVYSSGQAQYEVRMNLFFEIVLVSTNNFPSWMTLHSTAFLLTLVTRL
jgi:hypothetical protein